MTRILTGAAIAAATGLALAGPHAGAEQGEVAFEWPKVTFTSSQVDEGRQIYVAGCAGCHGANLKGGGARPLTGRTFLGRWAGGNSLGAMYKYIRDNMPPGGAGSLSASQIASLMALILQENGEKPGTEPLPADHLALQKLYLQFNGDTSGGLSLQAKLPPWPDRPDPAARLTPVTDAMLQAPAAGDWLSWRRTLDGQGFSPLDQITKENVGSLRLAWSYNLSPGPNAATPLVHDGVIFVYSNRDQVDALNAATGDVLWTYRRELPPPVGGLPPRVKRNMALYGDRLYLATADGKLIALDVRTGELVWESLAGETSGGPLVVNGAVVQGLFRGRRMPAAQARESQGGAPSTKGVSCVTCGGFARILGFGADDGKPLWTFNVVPQRGEPGENSWNDLPFSQRSGGSVWTSGYYDPELDLVFIGTGNTYNTSPLAKPIGKRGVTNDALYTDSTLALRPASGELVWYYQHHARDLWDLDWVFERMIVNLSVGGRQRKAVVTMGKTGILDALEAADGKYLFSIDPGLQNVITHIDPKTGRKATDPALVPGEETKVVCPNSQGVKNWIPGSFDAQNSTLFMPMNLACMEMAPVDPGERSPLSSGLRWSILPRPGSDGRVGRVQAFDLAARKTKWIAAQRAPMTSGVLATAGGLVFAGSLDRKFSAFDEATGEQLWSTRLGDVPSGAPISFAVGGKQYVAIVAGYGAMLHSAYLPLVPEIPVPTTPSSSIYVFELP